MDGEEEKKLYTEAERSMEIIYGRLIEVRSHITALTKSEKKGKSPPDKKSVIKVKKLDAPAFGGELTEYPSFIRDYETHMKPVYGDDPYALKKCLHGDALSAVRGVDDDFDGMKGRLDNKYGRPDKLANAIINKLKAMKAVPEGDSNKFLELVDTVERCWLEMKRLDVKEEMNNVTMVTEIEKLLPNQLLREWCIQKAEFQLALRRDQFPDLLKFLVRENETMEYIMENNGVGKKHKEIKLSTHAVTQ